MFIRNFIDILSDLFLGYILNIQKKKYIYISLFATFLNNNKNYLDDQRLLNINNLKLKLFYNYSNLIIFVSLNIRKQIKLKLKYTEKSFFVTVRAKNIY